MCGSSLTHSFGLAWLPCVSCACRGSHLFSSWPEIVEPVNMQFLIANTQWFIISLWYPRYSPVTLLIRTNRCGNYSTTMIPAYSEWTQLIPVASTLACHCFPPLTTCLLVWLKDAFPSSASEDSEDFTTLNAFPGSPVEQTEKASSCQLTLLSAGYLHSLGCFCLELPFNSINPHLSQISLLSNGCLVFHPLIPLLTLFLSFDMRLLPSWPSSPS